MYINKFLVCTHMGVFTVHFPAQRGNPKPSKPQTQQVFWDLTHPRPSFESSITFPTRPWSSWSFAQTEGVTTSLGKVKLLKAQLLIPKPIPNIPPQALRDPKVWLEVHLVADWRNWRATSQLPSPSPVWASPRKCQHLQLC